MAHQLTDTLNGLLASREAHVGALAKIDSIIAHIETALGTPRKVVAAVHAKPARKPGRRSKFKVTSEQFVLDFLQGHKNPTTGEINQYWKAQGRNGNADMTLMMLVKKKKLKRTKVKGGRGSMYSMV